MQQDNDPKHTTKSTYEWLKKKKRLYFGVAKSKSGRKSNCEILWHDLKQSCPFMLENSSVAEFKIILQKKSGPKFIHSDVKD